MGQSFAVGLCYIAVYEVLTFPLVDLEKGETPIASFPEFCFHVYQTAVLHTDFYVGLGKTGKVYVVSRDQEARTLVTNANSLALTSGFIIFATTAHEAVFVPLSSLPSILEKSEEGMKELQGTWESRKVERGSRIVVPVPSSTGLVLQMPRGNLETIYPRPMVMEVVNQDVDEYVYFSFEAYKLGSFWTQWQLSESLLCMSQASH